MSVSIQPEIEDNQPSSTPFIPFPTTPLIPDNDLYTLISDFFGWLETDWQLATFASKTTLPPLPQALTLTEDLYTIKGLAQLYGYSYGHALSLFKTHGIVPLRDYSRKEVKPAL